MKRAGMQSLRAAPGRQEGDRKGEGGQSPSQVRGPAMGARDLQNQAEQTQGQLSCEEGQADSRSSAQTGTNGGQQQEADHPLPGGWPSSPREAGRCPLLQAPPPRHLQHLLADNCTNWVPGQAGRGTRDLWDSPAWKGKTPFGRVTHKTIANIYVSDTVGFGHSGYHSCPQPASHLLGKSTSQ